MKIRETGFILFLENYKRNVEFYSLILGLSIREQKEDLTIFDFGNSYLMVEANGVGSEVEKTRAQNPTVIRIDVEDFDKTLEDLKRQLDVKVYRHIWGTIGVIIDPEGNRIELKDVSLS
ncbi:VOC family protein [Paenibacillus dakarensis]|uniref:VOC family protein n=1 Tax=Paenibacillus dakarensis TaxID=1527293 RepID=UPI0006D589F1|nr:VOC family protein [Paenibacillus dakarensis]